MNLIYTKLKKYSLLIICINVSVVYLHLQFLLPLYLTMFIMLKMIIAWILPIVLTQLSFLTLFLILLFIVLIYNLTIEFKVKHKFISKYPLIPILRPKFPKLYNYLEKFRMEIWKPYSIRTYEERRGFIIFSIRFFVLIYISILLIFFGFIYKINLGLNFGVLYYSLIILGTLILYYNIKKGSTSETEVNIKIKTFKIKYEKAYVFEICVLFVISIFFFEIGMFKIIEIIELLKNIKFTNIVFAFDLSEYIMRINKYIENVMFYLDKFNLKTSKSETFYPLYFEGINTSINNFKNQNIMKKESIILDLNVLFKKVQFESQNPYNTFKIVKMFKMRSRETSFLNKHISKKKPILWLHIETKVGRPVFWGVRIKVAELIGSPFHSDYVSKINFNRRKYLAYMYKKKENNINIKNDFVYNWSTLFIKNTILKLGNLMDTTFNIFDERIYTKNINVVKMNYQINNIYNIENTQKQMDRKRHFLFLGDIFKYREIQKAKYIKQGRGLNKRWKLLKDYLEIKRPWLHPRTKKSKSWNLYFEYLEKPNKEEFYKRNLIKELRLKKAYVLKYKFKKIKKESYIIKSFIELYKFKPFLKLTKKKFLMWKDVRFKIINAKKEEFLITNNLLKKRISMQSIKNATRHYLKTKTGLGIVKCKNIYLYRKKEALKIKKWKEWATNCFITGQNKDWDEEPSYPYILPCNFNFEKIEKERTYIFKYGFWEFLMFKLKILKNPYQDKAFWLVNYACKVHFLKQTWWKDRLSKNKEYWDSFLSVRDNDDLYTFYKEEEEINNWKYILKDEENQKNKVFKNTLKKNSSMKFQFQFQHRNRNPKNEL